MAALYEGVGVIRQLNVDIAPNIPLGQAGPVVLASEHEAAVASLAAQVEELKREVAEYVAANRDQVKFTDHWKARAEAAESALAAKEAEAKRLAEALAGARTLAEMLVWPKSLGKETTAALKARLAEIDAAISENGR